MTNFGRRDGTYMALDNELTPPLGHLSESAAAPTLITFDHDHEDATNVIIHKVPKTKGWSSTFLVFVLLVLSKKSSLDYFCLILSQFPLEIVSKLVKASVIK